jgi:hypothetical protein
MRAMIGALVRLFLAIASATATASTAMLDVAYGYDAAASSMITVVSLRTVAQRRETRPADGVAGVDVLADTLLAAKRERGVLNLFKWKEPHFYNRI